jgi:hypothetical protein
METKKEFKIKAAFYSTMIRDEVTVTAIPQLLEYKDLPKLYIKGGNYMFRIAKENSIEIHYSYRIKKIKVGETYRATYYNRAMEFAHECYLRYKILKERKQESECNNINNNINIKDNIN